MPPETIHFGKTSEIHISEAEAVKDFARVLAYIREGVKVVIDSEGGSTPVAVIFPAERPLVGTTAATVPTTRRTVAGVIARLPENSTAVMDADFARDIEAGIASHREPLRSTWE